MPGPSRRLLGPSAALAGVAVVVSVAVVAGVAGGARADPARFEGGHHVRLVTPRGPVHLWRPDGYARREASIVVYVHGYWTDVDRAWTDHQLARQFAASGKNALFVVPEAPDSKRADVAWPSLGELLAAVARRTGEPLPPGPVVAIGHSGAFRTIAEWLGHPRLDHVILLDGLYGAADRFAAWLDGDPARRLVVAAADTLGQSDDLARAFAPRALQLGRVPDSPRDLGPAEREAPLLLLRSQYGHMEIVTEGRVVPLLLHLTPIPRCDAP